MTFFFTIIVVIAVVLLALHIWTRRLTSQGASLVPQMGQIVPVSGGSIHYVEAGDTSNPTIVMIHGLSGQLQHFTYALVDILADDFHVIALDRPGCGYSTRDNAQLGILSEQARMIDEFLQTKGVEKPILVGHSLGGAVSLAMALDYPDRVRALALLCPLTHKVPETPTVFKALELRTEWLRNLIGNTVAVPLARKTAPHVLSEVFSPEPAPEDFLDKAGGALGLRPSAFITASQDFIGADSSIEAQSARYDGLNVPGALLFGAQDPILSPAQQGTTMAQFGFQVEQLDGRGHMILITAPDECAAFIRKVAQSA